MTQTMNTTEHPSKRQIAELFYAAMSTGDSSLLDRSLSPDWIDHTLPAGRQPGREGIRQALHILRTAIPDLVCTVQEMFFSEDKVITRIVFSGTHTGEFLGAPPTGQPIQFIAFDIHRVSHDQIVESWHLEDNLTLFQQTRLIQFPS
ncbi:ester cyclase [Leptolyngbya sp. NIES-2104]|uniref:ester cyclase n=1 Tax=Leptolyngbya sp. NIES-2104 TaxID=1552121 RepID=UPI0006ECC0D2|nr:ester cyclase [Leptolyngbya sp. NIES-2104]GAP97994.1 hypothetical protein NIES2104_45470 [Leptolyngbya sp. NIES-2104]